MRVKDGNGFCCCQRDGCEHPVCKIKLGNMHDKIGGDE